MSPGPRTVDLPHPNHRGIDRYSIALIRPRTFAELWAEFRRIADAREGRTFVILDDVDQCLYTSGHAANGHDLDEGVEYPGDDSGPATAQYEADRFAAVLGVLEASDSNAHWGSLPEEFVTGENDIDALVRLNSDPSVLLDDSHVVQNVPDAGVASLLADLPNGYFSGDWTPFQSLAVTRRLHERHGYQPWGIGARSLAFHRPAGAMSSDLGDALIADLQHVYGQADSPAWADLAALVQSSPLLLLGYTEDFAELVSDDA
jgi:hypothetical protein